VTCGEYTEHARQFAAGKPIRLIHGGMLLDMIRSVQPASSAGVFRREPQGEVSPGREGEDSVPNCPKCGSRMVRRTARAGVTAGQGFWGCSGFPKCRGIRPG
jgi:restriction system protein